MEKQLLELILPKGLLDHFDIEDVERGTESDGAPYIRIHLTEKNQLPAGCDPDEFESKGFHQPTSLVDFPIRGQFVYLSIKRRRWRNKYNPNQVVSNDYSHLAEGTKMTAELSAFLKATGGDADRID